MEEESRTVILIGGAPTTGKSTMAHMLSKHLGLPWISTDQIREIMRGLVSRKDYPKLFAPEGYDGERFLKEFSSEEIVKMEIEQGEALWPQVKKFIEKDYTWEEGFIVEGVGLLPKLIKKDFGKNKNIKAVFLVDEDADRIREVVFTRGLWDDADKYPDEVKEKEVEWATLFSHKLKREAKKNGFSCVEVKKDKEDLAPVLKALKLK